MLTIAILFWTGSRYPQLNEKALMGTQTESMGISFDMPRVIQFRDSVFTQVVSHTINWIDTNKKGMTFGLLFGGILMVLFSLLKDYKSGNRWINTFIGVVIGAPLGVCVNCAAPIALGMKDAGAKTETALATMISSPTLNVIVMSMLFSLLPPYMVWLKIGSTIILLLLIIPLLTRYFKSSDKAISKVKPRKLPKFFRLPEIQLDTRVVEDSSWFGAIIWTIKGFFIGLWYLIRTAVPLMLLAGILGNILITFLPLEGLVGLIQTTSIYQSILLMLMIALIGTFLPVPIAFDVIITAILWGAGLPARYAMILLFTLGTFSVYSGLVVNSAFSRKLAIAMFLIVGTMGVANGTVGHYLEKNLSISYMLDYYDQLRDAEGKPAHYEVNAKDTTRLQRSEIDRIQQNADAPPKLIFKEANLEVFAKPLKTQNGSSNDWFTSIEPVQSGLDVPYKFSALYAQDPFGNQRSVATGDVHQDGYPDVLFASGSDLFLYANMSGSSFRAQNIEVPDSLNVFSAALIDLDNDGWLDVFFSTYREGNYVKYNRGGHFDHEELLKLPQTDGLILTVSPAFGDINGDGLLDILAGNMSTGHLGSQEFSVEEATNFWLINNGDRTFEMRLSEAPAGESLSTLISNYMGGDAQDVIVCNDFDMPNYFFEGKSSESMPALVKNPRDLVEKTTLTTMSTVTVDVDNDLTFEIYEAQTDQFNRNFRTVEISKICGGIEDDEQRGYCEVVFKKQQAYQATLKHRKFEHCGVDDLLDCVAFQLIRHKTLFDMPGKTEDYFTEKWDEYHFISELKYDESRRVEQYLADAPDAKRPGGLLLKKNSEGMYMDDTDRYGIRVTGWAWNAKFADLDNDGWQDLFIANGYVMKPIQESNMFYRNVNGEKFEELTIASGLENYLPSSSNSYVDYDLDGDLDIILATSVGPVSIYQNNNHQNKSVSFRLEDGIGNRFGIGSKITIYYGDEQHQVHELIASGGYKSFDQPVFSFGLGQVEKADRIVIQWSTGEESVINQSFLSGNLYTIKRNKNIN
jgi:uncharacterized membrane protein YraQ (UPF0718 family)